MKAFKYSPSNPYIQDIILEPGAYTFGASIFTNGYDNAIGLQTELGTWIPIPLEIKAASGWNSVVKTFTITQKCTKIDLMYSGTKTNLHILNPWLKKGANVTTPRTNEADLLEAVGEGSYTVLLSNENHTFAGTETTALAGSTETQVLVYKGTERIFPTSITVNTADLPTGMSRTISLETSRVTFNVTTSMTSPSGTIPITFVVEGRSMTILFSYSISFKGGKGEDAAIIRLTTPFQLISIDSSGTMIPSSPFVVIGTPTNTTITTWRYSTDGAPSSTTTPPTGVTRSGNTVTINPLTVTFKTLNISASNGTISDSITIVKVEDGGKGENSYTVLLSNGNHTFAGTETTALAGSTSTQILVYSELERVFPTSITVNTSDLPVGMTRSISLELSRVTFNVTTAMTSANGTIPITFVVNGRSMTAIFSYSISFKGGKGEDAAIIRLTGDTQFISVSKEGAVVPPSNFTVVGTAENTSISSWRYTVDSYSPSTTPPTGVSRSGNIVTINPNTSTFKLLTIIASDGTVSDSFSIARVTDGGDGGDAAYWELHSSAPLIYKDAEDASTSGVHTTITLSGRYVEGVSSQNGGYISVQPNGGVEGTPLISPREFTPPNNAGVDGYVIRLYNNVSKTTLLDTLTVPIAFKGEKGVSAINITLSNEADVLPATTDGVVTDYTGSGTTVRVFEGATELTYGTGNGQYQVSASGSGITVGSASTSGNTRVYGVASNMTADNATITFTISGKTADGVSFSFTKTQSFSKSRVGASAPLLYLSVSAQVMKCNPDNTPLTGQEITINAKLQNIAGSALFSAIPYNSSGEELPPVTLWANINDANEKTLKSLQWLSTYQKVVITATLGSLTDKVTIYRIADGATGKDAIVGLLTNESVTLQANSAGVVSSFTSANGEFWVYNGTTKVTSGITFSKVSQTGCTAAITSTGAYSVSAMSAGNATVVLRAVYSGVTIDKVLTLSKSNAGADGEDGEGNVHIYRHSLLKPATPTSGVANPPGWVKSPDKGVSTPIPTNWTLKDKWYQSEELTTLGETSISVISFTTTLPNQVVVLELWADGHATYDYLYAGNLNIGVTTSNYYDRVLVGKKTISYDVPNAGSHSIQIMWRKGITAIVGSGRGYFAIIKDVKVWRSTTAIINKIYQSWSSPEEYYPDTSTEETIYCLSKTETPPLISDSSAYIDEYLPLPCALTSYRGDFSTSRAYTIAEVVVYSGEYYKIIKAVPSNYTGNPTNTGYFENIKGWTDNAKGATKAFPFEYRSKRKKSGGIWRAFSASTVDGRWVENGKPGEDGDGITSTDIHYAKSQNGVTPPTIAADWGTSLPTPVKGWYLWTRTTHNYRKSAPITSYSVSYWAEDGDNGKNIYLSASTQLIQFNSAGTPTPAGIVSVVGTAINTTITTWLYSVNGGNFGSALPAGVSRSGNTVNISPSTITFRTLTIHASDGTIVTTISIAALYDGSNGLPGKMPIQIEWTTGDLHLNNETVVHYIYYRAGNTWWRLKDTYTSRTASSTPSTTFYQQLSSVESFVTKILIAEQANLGGLIFKDNKLISQKGMINGVEVTDFANPLFKPYVYIDGSNGEIKANKLLNPFVLSDVDIPGDLQSKLTNNHNVYLDASGSGGSGWVYHTLPGLGTLADKALDGLNLKIYAPNGSNKRINISTAHANGLIFTENPETTTTKIEIVPRSRERIHLSAVWDRVAETLDWAITFRSSYMIKAQTTNTTEGRVPNVFKPNDIIFKGKVSSSGVVSSLVSFYNNSRALAASVTSNVFRLSIPFQSYLNTSGNLVARSMRDDQFGIEIYPETGQSTMYSYSLNRYLGNVGGINGVHFYIQFRNQSNVVSTAPFYFVVKALDYIFNNDNLSDTL